MRVLLVEDDYDLAEMYLLQLVKSGHQVFWAPSAQGALDQLDKQSINLIVLDMLLPANNGIAILHELRSYEDWSKIPVMIFSNVQPQELDIKPKQLEQLGVVSYLVKSHTKPAELAAAVSAMEEG